MCLFGRPVLLKSANEYDLFTVLFNPVADGFASIYKALCLPAMRAMASMNVLPGWRRWLQALVQGESNDNLDNAVMQHRDNLPVLWLLGKTGAGKSSIIQRLTGDSRAQIGSGFEPCTSTARLYDHPADAPVMRFLDTRGLGEADYNPVQDLTAARGGSHALLVLTRVDDTAQADVTNVLLSKELKTKNMAVLHVHTALHTLSLEESARAITFNEQQIATALGRKPASTSIDFSAPEDMLEYADVGLIELCESIVDLVPELSQALTQHSAKDGEEALFLQHRRYVLGYAGIAAAADVLPAVGLIAVPSIQGKMMYSLAARYGVTWDRRMASEFVAALGAGFLYRYALSLGARQLGKMIPVYGQSIGAAAAASISFASTYALGRTVALYLYRRQHKQPVDPKLLRRAFIKAFDDHRRSTR